MPQWEYKTVDAYIDAFGKGVFDIYMTRDQMLSAFGIQGWELVYVNSHSLSEQERLNLINKYSRDYMIAETYYFKRQKS